MGWQLVPLILLLGACRAGGPLDAGPEEMTIIWRAASSRQPETSIIKIAFTTDGESSYLRETKRGNLARLLSLEDMQVLLDSLEESGLGDLPTAADTQSPHPSIIARSGVKSAVWIGHLDGLENRTENLNVFRRAEGILIAWSATTQVHSRRKRSRTR